MSDHLSPQMRSWNMARIKDKDTTIEVKVRQHLFHEGFRFRKNDKRLPGKPDVVLPKYKTVIFIHGCFWHRHPGCKYAAHPKTHPEYWEEKFSRNIRNDEKHKKELEALGWQVITVWECEIKSHFDETMTHIRNQIIESSCSNEETR